MWSLNRGGSSGRFDCTVSLLWFNMSYKGRLVFSDRSVVCVLFDIS